MYKCYINCSCIADCPDFDIKRGQLFGGSMEFDKTGEPVFQIEHHDGGNIKCTLEWFKEFFELVE